MFGSYGLVDRTSYFLYVRTILLPGCIYRYSCYIRLPDILGWVMVPPEGIPASRGLPVPVSPYRRWLATVGLRGRLNSDTIPSSSPTLPLERGVCQIGGPRFLPPGCYSPRPIRPQVVPDSLKRLHIRSWSLSEYPLPAAHLSIRDHFFCEIQVFCGKVLGCGNGISSRSALNGASALDLPAATGGFRGNFF